MNRVILSIFLLSILNLIQLQAQHQRELRVKVYTIKDGFKEPIKNTTVILEENESKDVTDDLGIAKLYLSPHLKSGTRINLHVDKKGYVIQKPFDGQERIPADLVNDQINIEMIKKGSQRILNNIEIEKLVEKYIEKTKDQQRTDFGNNKVDFTTFLKKQASLYGLELRQVDSVVQKLWVDQIKSNETFSRGLAEFSKNNYKLASELLQKSAADKSKALKMVRSDNDTLIDNIVYTYRLAGDASYFNSDYLTAIKLYNSAISYMSDTSNFLWAKIMSDIGNSYHGIVAEYLPDSNKTLYFKLAKNSYIRASQIITRRDFQKFGGVLQMNLGAILIQEAMFSEVDNKDSLLNLGIELNKYSLEVFDRETQKDKWANAINNIGGALKQLGINHRGTLKGDSLLKESIKSYKLILKHFNGPSDQLFRSIALSNLGAVLDENIERTNLMVKRDSLIKDNINLYKDALKHLDKKQYPDYWSLFQANLGIALTQNGKNTTNVQDKIESFKKAIVVYNLSLENDKLTDKSRYYEFILGNLFSLSQAIYQQCQLNEKSSCNEMLKNILNIFKREERQILPDSNSIVSGKFQGRIALVYSYLEDTTNAIIYYKKLGRYYTNFLKKNPNDRGAYDIAIQIYHEILFDYNKSYELTTNWLDNNKYTSSPVFIFNLFTINQYEDCQQHIISWLTNPIYSENNKMLVRIVEIPNLIALGNKSEVGNKLDTMVIILKNHPEIITQNIATKGIEHFVKETDLFIPYRDWLINYILAFSNDNHNDLIKNISDLKSKFIRITKD